MVTSVKRVVLDVITPGYTFSENDLTSTIRDNTGSSLSTDDTWIIGSTWSRGFSGVHKMFMKSEIRLNPSPEEEKNLLKPEIRLKFFSVNTISQSKTHIKLYAYHLQQLLSTSESPLQVVPRVAVSR